ncbi:NAD(P)-binding domain-containing protein [Rhodocytophaga rosea]|uniref:NAD(P)-binding domain-containing protein n=1 Tax=Rhodocytophaga rosea TaxID=2704465 RepID=A0A6C0GLT3_9BACT|nr:NAD(P)/FAD-dependent oxidoreductase [Rhodocytophaga rosea]QHT68774.1 NAD(P)-binding domain-containing protein [Rhodocytophaga rosea]
MNTTRVEVIIVGAGHAGLSASYLLKKAGLSHVVFERGKTGESWRSQRWNSFVLNTANKLNVLPGASIPEKNADGFSTAKEFVTSLEEYVSTFQLPVVENATVLAIEKSADSTLFQVTVSENNRLRKYESGQVIIASGAASETTIPELSKGISPTIKQLHAGEYRHPGQFPEGAVLVVGSAQSGCQITQDLADAGRKVYLSTSKVARLPRRYRGRDILDWLIDAKFFDVRAEDITDPAQLHMKAPQLTGVGEGKHTISLQALAKKGITILGKIESISENTVSLVSNASSHIQFADGFSAHVKGMIDEVIAKHQLPVPAAEKDEADAPDTDTSSASLLTTLNLEENNIGTIIWATGFGCNFQYIKLPILDKNGHPKHYNGISEVNGLYFLGLPWLRFRKSGLIYGIHEDAAFITGEVLQFTQKQIPHLVS